MATVLARSYREHHPGATVHCCVVDEPDPAIDYDALPFEVLFARQLNVPAFQNFAFRYDLLELSTAVKPYLLAHLRDDRDLDRTLYLDPDIWVCDRFSGIESALETHQAVLTPHITRPLDNSHNPSERKIRMTGVYNLGFLGLRLDESTRPFLDWWAERLHQHGHNDPFAGVFVDQSWMDFTPAFLDRVAILRDPVYNVAYWNLPHRHPRNEGERWSIGGRPVAFFHFSGIDLGDLAILSRHQDRIRPHQRRELRPLLEAYREAVLAAGYRDLRDRPYAYGCFDNGVLIPGLARRLLQRVDPLGRRWPDPFAGQGPDSYYHWLTEPVRFPQGSLNRLVLALWEQRSYLLREFPQVVGRDLDVFCRWLLEAEGAAREGLPSVMLDGVGCDRAAVVSGFLPDWRPEELAGHDLGWELLQLARSRGEPEVWLNLAIPGTARRRPILTRTALLVHSARGDLGAAFPDPLGEDQEGFAYWFCRFGGDEVGLPERLIAPVRRSLPLRKRLVLALRGLRRRGRRPEDAVSSRPEAPQGDRPAATLPDAAAPSSASAGHRGAAAGVNLCSFEGGRHEVRLLLEALHTAVEEAQLPHVLTRTDGEVWGRLLGRRLQSEAGAPYDLTLFCGTPDRLADGLRRLPLPTTVAGRLIGYWWWDLAYLPVQLAYAFHFFEEIWTPSRFTATAIGALADVPVRWLAPPVIPPDPIAPDRQRVCREADRFCLFATCDLEDPTSQSPQAVLDLARRTAAADAPVAVWLHLLHAGGEGRVDELRRAAEGLPVEVDATPLSRRELLGHLSVCDGYLSLDHGRAFAFDAVAAARLGKPVVATGYGGITDWLDEESGSPVSFHRVRLDENRGPYWKGLVWAKADVEAAAGAVVDAATDPSAAAERSARGRRRVEELFGRPAVRRMQQEVERLLHGPG